MNTENIISNIVQKTKILRGLMKLHQKICQYQTTKTPGKRHILNVMDVLKMSIGQLLFIGNLRSC